MVYFMDNEIYPLPEFNNAAKEIVSAFDVPEFNTKKIGLFKLMRFLMKEAVNIDFTDADIDYYVKVFLNDYVTGKNDALFTWDIELWLGNVYFESNEIILGDKILLSKPTKEELTLTRPKSYHTDSFERMTGRQLISSTILSFSMLSGERPMIGTYQLNILDEIETWVNAFRLFKPSDVIVVYQSTIPVSICEHGVSEDKEQPSDKFPYEKVEHKDISSSYKLYIKKDEEELLPPFIQKMQPILREISQNTYLSGNSYELSFHRYNDALLKTNVNAYKILSSISSIEALLSNSDKKIAHNLRCRVAKLLSIYGFRESEVMEKIKIAYNLRSKLVHGTKPEDNQVDLLDFARKHTHEIINFNRICLLTALQLKGKISNDDLIKIIDQACLNQKGDEELKKLIEESVFIPVINPFKQI